MERESILCLLAGGSIWHYADSDRDGSGMDCPIHDGLDECEVVVVNVVFVLLTSSWSSWSSLVDGRELDASLVEEFDDLWN